MIPMKLKESLKEMVYNTNNSNNNNNDNIKTF